MHSLVRVFTENAPFIEHFTGWNYLNIWSNSKTMNLIHSSFMNLSNRFLHLVVVWQSYPMKFSMETLVNRGKGFYAFQVGIANFTIWSIASSDTLQIVVSTTKKWFTNNIFGYFDDDPVDILNREGISLVGLNHHRLHHTHLCRLLQHGKLSF